MENLPIELIELILSNSTLSIGDIINFSFTSKYLRELVTLHDFIWKKKYRERWSYCEKNIKLDGNNIESYYKETFKVLNIKKRIDLELEDLPKKFGKKQYLSDYDLRNWDQVVGKNCESYWYCVDYILQILNASALIDHPDTISFNSPGNKTRNYYGLKVIRYIRQKYLSNAWKNYVTLPPRQQLPEKGALIIAQWFQPDKEIFYDEMARQISDIVDLVRDKLYFINDRHKLFKISKETLKKWEQYSIEEVVYSKDEFQELLNAIKEVMFFDLGFSTDIRSYYLPGNSFIDHVLETRKGLPITLIIIYEAVARRLGLKCEAVCSSIYTFAKVNRTNSSYVFVDINNSGFQHEQLLFFPQTRDFANDNESRKYYCLTTFTLLTDLAKTLEVSSRHYSGGIDNNRVTIQRSSLELLHLLLPKNVTNLINLGKLYVQNGINTSRLEKLLIEHQETECQTPLVDAFLEKLSTVQSLINMERPNFQHRPSNLKYAVGMVMIHLALDYRCVIEDWDPECLASAEWREKNQVDTLKMGAKQPFYMVLNEDGWHRYVAQENLRPTLGLGYLFQNEGIGRHFSHFYQTHFVPNLEKEKQYPEDKQVRMFYHSKLLNESY